MIFFLWKYYFGHTTFLYSSRRSSGHQSFFFNFRFSSRKYQNQQTLVTKITHFTIQSRSKMLSHFTNLNSLDIENNMPPQHSQKPLWICQFSSKQISDAQKMHSWTILEANDCSVYLGKKTFVPKSSRILHDGGVGGGGKLNNFLEATNCLDPVKCFTIFHFKWNFWKFNYISAFWYFHL